MAERVIENIVVSANINQKLPLQNLSISIVNCEYDTKDSVLIFRFDHPKRAVLITEQGIISVTGIKTIEDGRDLIYKVFEILKQNGIQIDQLPEIQLNNFVISTNRGKELDLISISQQLQPEKTIYKPEENPWIEYFHDEHITFLICSSGRIVCTGTCTIDDADQTIDMLLNMLE